MKTLFEAAQAEADHIIETRFGADTGSEMVVCEGCGAIIASVVIDEDHRPGCPKLDGGRDAAEWNDLDWEADHDR